MRTCSNKRAFGRLDYATHVGAALYESSLANRSWRLLCGQNYCIALFDTGDTSENAAGATAAAGAYYWGFGLVGLGFKGFVKPTLFEVQAAFPSLDGTIAQWDTKGQSLALVDSSGSALFCLISSEQEHARCHRREPNEDKFQFRAEQVAVLSTTGEV